MHVLVLVRTLYGQNRMRDAVFPVQKFNMTL